MYGKQFYFKFGPLSLLDIELEYIWKDNASLDFHNSIIIIFDMFFTYGVKMLFNLIYIQKRMGIDIIKNFLFKKK